HPPTLSPYTTLFRSLEFLDIIARQWPAILAGEGLIDIIEHRNRQLTATARIWKQQPPAYPVIAAGSTGSQPAAAALMAVIAGLRSEEHTSELQSREN